MLCQCLPLKIQIYTTIVSKSSSSFFAIWTLCHRIAMSFVKRRSIQVMLFLTHVHRWSKRKFNLASCCVIYCILTTHLQTVALPNKNPAYLQLNCFTRTIVVLPVWYCLLEFGCFLFCFLLKWMVTESVSKGRVHPKIKKTATNLFTLRWT